MHTLLVGSQQVEVLVWRHLGFHISLAMFLAGCPEASREIQGLSVLLFTDNEPSGGLITQLL